MIAKVLLAKGTLNRMRARFMRPPPIQGTKATSTLPPGTSYVALNALIYSKPESLARKPKKVNQPAEVPVDETKTPSPPVLPTPPPQIVATHILKHREDYRVFSVIMGLEKSDVTFHQIRKCFATLQFSIIPKTGKIYQFKYKNSAALIPEEGATEFFTQASKNFHEPHIKGKYTAHTPLPHSIVDRFKQLLFKAGMNSETVKFREE